MLHGTRPSVVIGLHGDNTGLVNLFREHQMKVQVARTGIEVVSFLFPRGDSYAEPPSIMILSALFPGYNGLSVLAGVRSFGWRTPVVLTWPSDEDWIPAEALRLGCAGLFEEPADWRALAQAALSVLGRGLPSEADPMHGGALKRLGPHGSAA